MRILFVTNYYPPSPYSWGYQQLCEEVAEGLFARGHLVGVLTSIHGNDDQEVHAYPVRCLLPLDPNWHNGKSGIQQFFVGRRRRERQAQQALRQTYQEFQPDVIFVWHTLGLPSVLLRSIESLSGIPVAYYLADYSPESPDEYIAYWESTATHRFTRWLKFPLAKVALKLLKHEGKPIMLRYENTICVSEYLRQRLVSSGLIADAAVVIHNGVDFQYFSPGERKLPAFDSLHCLIAGRVVPDKGIHTTIQALGESTDQIPHNKIRLTILGSGSAAYGAQLQNLVRAQQLQAQVEFHSPLPRNQMPQVMTNYNVLLLASEYAEPLARSMQEAMAIGLLVIGTTTGGSGELLVHEKTGLAFEAGNPTSLSQQLQRALREPVLAARLASAGQAVVKTEFNIQRTINQIEAYLLDLAAKHGQP